MDLNLKTIFIQEINYLKLLKQKWRDVLFKIFTTSVKQNNLKRISFSKFCKHLKKYFPKMQHMRDRNGARW